MSLPRPRAPLAVLVLALALVAGLLALMVARPGSSDDLFVVLVYARNLLQEGQVLHEVGDGPIEGFTSPLDVLLKTLALLVWPGDGVGAAGRASLIIYLCAIGAGCWAAARWARGPVFVLGSIALALAPGLAEGTSYILEAPLVALGLCLLSPGPAPALSALRCSLVAVALFLVRPELGLVALVWALPMGTDGPRRLRPLLVTLVGLASITLVRVLAFGSPVPSSFQAKASDVRWFELADGLSYVGDFLSPAVFGPAAIGHLLLLVGALYYPWADRSGQSLVPRGVLLGPAACLVAVIVSGGDGYQGARLMVPFSVLSLIATIALASRGSGPARVGAKLVLAAVCGTQLATVLPQLPGPRKTLGAFLNPVTLGEEAFALEREALRRLTDELPHGSVLASRHLQMAEYFQPGLGFLDLTGLNDRSVLSLPAPGRVLFGRTSLAPALEARVEAIHLHHQVLSEEVLASASTGSWLSAPAGSKETLGNPLPSGGSADLLSRNYRTVTLLAIGGTGLNLNLLVRSDLASGWVGRQGLIVGPPN